MPGEPESSGHTEAEHAQGPAIAPEDWTEGAVKAIVVWASRPTSAKPGDSAWILPSGEVRGFVGGQCALASVRVAAERCRISERPLLLQIVPGDDSSGPLSALGTVEEGVETVSNPCLSGGAMAIFLQPHLAAPLVVVHGTSPVAEAVLDAGPALGFDTARDYDPHRVPAAVLIATHGGDESAMLNTALASGARYVGVVASRKRSAALLASVGLSDQQAGRVHSPAGLDIGARRPGEIAASIYAEIIATTKTTAGSEDLPVDQIATEAEDPVCHMVVAAVEGTLHADIAGQRYYFCSPHCRDSFVASGTHILT